ncbi:unnamed protein product, partial [Leptidea sinapis]
MYDQTEVARDIENKVGTKEIAEIREDMIKNEVELDEFDYFDVFEETSHVKNEIGNIEVSHEYTEKKKKSNSRWSQQYNNIRYKVIEISNEEFKRIKMNCKKVFIDDNERSFWMEKEKNARNYSTMDYKCESCISGFSKIQQYEAHIKLYHTKAKNLIECSICTKQLPDNKINAHIKKHNIKYICSVCDYECHKYHQLDTHVAYSHRRKYFLTGYRLRQHKASVHDNIPKARNKVCTICGRAFSTNRILQNHVRTHTGERPYQCDFCASTFIQKIALVTHLKSIHK